MRVYITTSVRNIDTNIVYLRKITELIHKNGGDSVADWVEAANKRLARATLENNHLDWDMMVRTHMHAFNEADIIVIEGSEYNFSNGFWSALSLVKFKPTLFLYRYNRPDAADIDALFVSGLMSDSFEVRHYTTEQDLELIIDRFMKTHNQPKRHIELELNTFLDNYIEKASRKTNKSRQAVIKDILLKEIQKDEGIPA